MSIKVQRNTKKMVVQAPLVVVKLCLKADNFLLQRTAFKAVRMRKSTLNFLTFLCSKLDMNRNIKLKAVYDMFHMFCATLIGTELSEA